MCERCVKFDSSVVVEAHSRLGGVPSSTVLDHMQC